MSVLPEAESYLSGVMQVVLRFWCQRAFHSTELKGQVPFNDGIFMFQLFAQESGEVVDDRLRIINHDGCPESRGALLDHVRGLVS